MALDRFPDITEADLPAMRAAFTGIADASITGDAQAVREATLHLAVVGKLPAEVAESGELDPFIERMADAEMQHFLAHDPAPAFSLADVPILAVWGGVDVHTAPRLNAPPLLASHNPAGPLTALILPGEDHFFMRGDGPEPGEHQFGRMRLSPDIIGVIARWIDQPPLTSR